MPILALAFAAGTLAMSTDLVGSAWRPSLIHAHSVPAEERVYITFKDDGRVFGNGGCNHFFSVYATDGNTIKIGPIASTKKGCPGKYELETSFFSVLESAKTYELHETTLVLFNGYGQPIAELIKTDNA